MTKSKPRLTKIKPQFQYSPDTIMGELERLRFEVKQILSLLTETKRKTKLKDGRTWTSIWLG